MSVFPKQDHYDQYTPPATPTIYEPHATHWSKPRRSASSDLTGYGDELQLKIDQLRESVKILQHKSEFLEETLKNTVDNRIAVHAELEIVRADETPLPLPSLSAMAVMDRRRPVSRSKTSIDVGRLVWEARLPPRLTSVDLTREVGPPCTKSLSLPEVGIACEARKSAKVKTISVTTAVPRRDPVSVQTVQFAPGLQPASRPQPPAIPPRPTRRVARGKASLDIGVTLSEPRKSEAKTVEEKKVEENKIEENKIEENKIEEKKIEEKKIEAKKIEAKKIEAKKIEAKEIEEKKSEEKKRDALRDSTFDRIIELWKSIERVEVKSAEPMVSSSIRVS
jgi:hypothetical protein